MSASLLSSFIIFLLGGVFAILDVYGGLSSFLTAFGGEQIEGQLFLGNSWLAKVDDRITEVLVFVAVYANAVYFYYFAAMCEMEPEFVKRLQDAPLHEWWIRFFNSTLFLSIWFWIQVSPLTFMLYMIVLYASFIGWDLVTRKYLERDQAGDDPTEIRKSLMSSDVVGLFCSIGFGLALIAIDGSTGEVESWKYTLLGVSVAAMIGLVIVSIVRSFNENKFNPFSFRYFRRNTVR